MPEFLTPRDVLLHLKRFVDELPEHGSLLDGFGEPEELTVDEAVAELDEMYLRHE